MTDSSLPDDFVAAALRGPAELRRRELPLAMAATLLVAGAASFYLAQGWPVLWGAAVCAAFVSDNALQARLALAPDAPMERWRPALLAWAAVISSLYALCPTLLWIDGHAAGMAGAAAIWWASLMRCLSQWPRDRIRTYASAGPVVISALAAPVARALIEHAHWSDLLMFAAAIGMTTVAARFWIDAARQKADLLDALEQARRQGSIAEVMSANMQVSVVVYDRDQRIVRANRRFETAQGRDGSSMIGRILPVALYEPSDALLEGLRAALYGHSTAGEHDAVTGWGRRVFKWRIAPWRDDSGEIVGGVFQSEDITDFATVSRAGEANAQRFDAALGVSRSVVWEYEFAAREITFHGDPAPIYGRFFSIGEMSPATSPFFLDEDRATLETYYSLTRPDDCVFEHRIRRPNGEIAWLQIAARNLYENGVLSRILAVSSDITERKREEESFVEAMRRAEHALETKRAMIHDALDLELDAPERAADDAAPPSVGVAEMFARLGRLLREIDARDDALALAVGSLRDAREAAEAASQAKSNFLANVSHELRTPLNAIIGYAEILLEGAQDDGRADDIEDAERVLFAARQLLHLINEILDLSKIEAGRIDVQDGEFDVAELVRHAVDTVRPQLAKNGNRIVVQCDGDTMGHANTDAFRLSQCLLNLLANAAKFTQNGAVTLNVRRDEDVDGDWLVFEVDDTGIGMSEDVMARLFQPFVQADASTTRRFGGTGLGLAITRRTIEALGGSVSAFSVAGHGSTFTLRAPATFRAAEAAPIARSA